MTAYVRSTDVNLAQNSKFIQVNDSATIGNIRDGWSIFINQQLVGIAKSVNTAGSPPTIELYETYTGTAITSGTMYAVITQGVINAIGERLTNLTNTYEQVVDSVSVTPTANSLAKRTNDGRLKATNAVDSNDVVVLGQTGSVITLDQKTTSVSSPLTQKAPTIFIPDTLRAQVELATQGKNTVLYNANGDPSIMFPVYKFRYEDLGFAGNPFGTGVATAFLKNGVEKSEIFIGCFQGRVHNGQVVSLPGLDPTTGINFDNSKARCAANGAGWHLMTEHEWAAITLWCMANGYQPRGNTNYGRAHDATHEVGRRQDGGIAGDTSGTARILTGTGPDAWRHDGSPFGIADLVGNIFEWTDLLKIVRGQVICAPDNDFDLGEANWVAQQAFFDSASTGTSGNLGAPTLADAVTNYADADPDNNSNDGAYNPINPWSNMTTSNNYVSNELMKRLMIEPAGISPQGYLTVRNYGERFPRRGGNWSNGSNAGLAARLLTHSRSHPDSSVGFRPAFVA